MAMKMATNRAKNSYDVVVAKRLEANAWNVEAVDEEGGIEHAILAGPFA